MIVHFIVSASRSWYIGALIINEELVVLLFVCVCGTIDSPVTSNTRDSPFKSRFGIIASLTNRVPSASDVATGPGF